MSESAQAADAATAPIVESEPITPDQGISASDAARMLASLRGKKEEEPAEDAEPATAEESPAKADDSDPDDRAHAEETEEVEPEKTPPIDPPRFWTSEAKERFNSLPRETQQYIVEREQARDAEVRRTQNETAEQRKAYEAKVAEVEKARTEYEAKLPAIMQMLQNQGEFADIKTFEDVQKLQREDPFRFQSWQLHQMQVQAVNAEVQQAEQRKAQETQKQAAERKTREHSLLLERAPELADPKKLDAAQKAVVELLRTKGFTDSDFAKIASNELLDDHRLQLALWDAARYADLQKVKVEAVKKPLPPVQRPGAAAPRGAAASENAQNLSRKLDQTGSVDDAFALLLAQRKAS